MLRPAECVTNRGRLVRTGSGDERVRNLMKERRRNAANFLHHFGRVAGKVPAQRLENAARMLQGQVARWKTELAFIEPALFVVSALLFVPAGEETGRPFLGV